MDRRRFGKRSVGHRGSSLRKQSPSMPRYIAIAVVIAAACSPAGAPVPGTVAPATADSGFTVRPMGSGVYAVLRNEPLGFINESNTLFIVGDRDVVVVDAQSSSARTRETLAALRAITDKPVSALINTHWHDDHVVGNEVYRAAFPGVRVIGHATNAEDMATMGVQFRRGGVAAKAGTIGLLRSFVERKQSFLGGPIDSAESRSHELSAWLLNDYSNGAAEFLPLPPTETVTDAMIISQGKRRIEVRFLGRAHTRGDLVVILPAEGIVATGDLLMNPVQFVGSTSFPKDFIGVLDRIQALAPRIVVPGHGKVLSRVEAAEHAKNIAATLSYIVGQAEQAVARGDSLSQLNRRLEMAPYRQAMAGSSRLNAGLFNYYVAGSATARAYELARSGK